MFDPNELRQPGPQQLTTLQMQYNMVKSNLTHFSFKQQWQTALHTLENVNVSNMFGETGGIKIPLNTNNPGAFTGWQTATVPMSTSTSTYLAGTVARQLAHLPACDDRDIRCCLSRLPHSRGPVPFR